MLQFGFADDALDVVRFPLSNACVEQAEAEREFKFTAEHIKHFAHENKSRLASRITLSRKRGYGHPKARWGNLNANVAVELPPAVKTFRVPEVNYLRYGDGSIYKELYDPRGSFCHDPYPLLELNQL